MIKTHACYDPKKPFPQDARIGHGETVIDDEEGTHIPPHRAWSLFLSR